MIPLKRAVLSSLIGLGIVSKVLAAPLAMPVATQQRLGIATSPLVSIRHSETVSGYARILDPLPLASLDADLASAIAVAEASRAEADRTRLLNAGGAAVSTRAAEAAQAQARVDAAHVTLLRRQLALQWGPIAALTDARRSALIYLLTTGRAALVRIDSPGAAGQGALSSVDVSFQGLGTVHVAILGSARTADTRMGSPGLIGKATGPLAERLAVGLTTPVNLPVRGGGSGVVLPRTALLRTAGQTWVYVKLGPTTFERRAVLGAVATDTGLFAVKGFAAGDPVVTQGASMLFSAETASANPASRED